MKFVIPTQKLTSIVSKCFNIIGQKTQVIPILSNVLIEAANDELVITATDLVVGIRCYTEAKILEEGSTTLPAKHFLQLLRELTAKNVTIHTNANELTEVTADSSHFKLLGMNRSEFPSLPDMSGSIQVKIPQTEFKEALFRTAFAVSREDNRYVLTGLNMRIANGTAVFVGTDGKCLARTNMSIAVDSQVTGNFNIPIKAVEEIERTLTNEGDLTLYLLADKIAVEASGTLIVTKLLSGNYPDVNQVIPKESTLRIALHREELMILLRQIALFTEDRGHSARFAFSQGELHLSANTPNVGEGQVSMPINYHGNKLEIAFNPNIFLDVLRHTKEETVTLGITDPYNPGLITDSDMPDMPTTARHLFVLMPMRLSEQ